jgi:hypothetical protein
MMTREHCRTGRHRKREQAPSPEDVFCREKPTGATEPVPFCRCLDMRSSHVGIVGCLLLAVAVATLAVTAGCGDRRPARVPVSGQVLIDGKPLDYGFIRLVPEHARPATADIQPDGRFTLKTFEAGDGVVPGTHPVMILGAEVLSSTKQRWHAPKKYADPCTSGLKATIDGPTDSLVIKLTWEGGKPFVETVP